jgi:O-antigen ligase
MPSHNKFTSRERTVMLLAGVVLVVAPWGWAGVVLWTVAAALGLAAAAFFAVVAEARAQRVVMAVAAVGLVAALGVAVADGLEPFSYRWLDHVCFPAALLAGSSLAWFLLSRDLVSRPAAEIRAEMLRSIPFWAGVLLFAYFAVQDWNAWGVAVDREAFWAAQGLPGIDVGKFDVRQQEYVRWLPSGLRAPFSSAETSQPPMNAWRQMMTLGAPWLLFLALRHGLRRRRGYLILGWTSVLAALAVGAFGVLNQKSYGTVLGFPVPYNTRSFGTFMNRNHAGVYLYLHAALALALTFWHIRRAGDNVLRGGPHLAAAFLAFALALLAALTNSTAGAAFALLLLVLAPLAAYWFGFPGSSGSRRRIMLITGGALALSAAAVLFVADLRPLLVRVQAKATNYQATGFDDRAPLRRATWALATDGGWTGRVWVGYGAGSYRWVSPPYQALQPEMLREGKLRFRALHAHNDWLEMLAEVGVIGLLPLLAFFGWLGRKLFRAFRPGHPETYPLALGLILLGLHATIDLLIWFTPLMFTAGFVLAAMTTFTEQSSFETERARS